MYGTLTSLSNMFTNPAHLFILEHPETPPRKRRVSVCFFYWLPSQTFPLHYHSHGLTVVSLTILWSHGVRRGFSRAAGLKREGARAPNPEKPYCPCHFHLFSSNLDSVNLILTEPHLIDMVLKIMKNNLRKNAEENLVKIILQLASFTSSHLVNMNTKARSKS